MRPRRAAHRRLAAPAPIAAVAAGWGFKDPTHFARRFRAAYGLRPQEWRRLAVEEALGGTHPVGDDLPTR